MKRPRIVILEFADGFRVDLVEAGGPEWRAITEFAGQCLAADPPASLPLLRAQTSDVPADRLAQLLNGSHSAAAEPQRPRSHPVPIAGIQRAIRAYSQRAITGATPEVMAEAVADLRRFFDHYEIEITDGDGRPDWLKTPEQAWKEGQ